METMTSINDDINDDNNDDINDDNNDDINDDNNDDINDDINDEFVESLSLYYDCSEDEQVSSLGNSENCSIKSSTRSTSISASALEINWTNLSKKILFFL
jgi:hypothetical protein